MYKKYLNFKSYLVKNGIKEKEVAKLLKVNPKTISKKINGRSDFTTKEVITICRKYKISCDTFI